MAHYISKIKPETAQIALITFGLLFWSLFATAQDTDVTEKIKQGLAGGNSSAVAALLAPDADLTVDGAEKEVTPQNASALLADFFRLHPPVSFSYLHKGSPKADKSYAIGVYTYKVSGKQALNENNAQSPSKASGFETKQYKVIVSVRLKGGQYLIESLEFGK